MRDIRHNRLPGLTLLTVLVALGAVVSGAAGQTFSGFGSAAWDTIPEMTEADWASIKGSAGTGSGFCTLPHNEPPMGCAAICIDAGLRKDCSMLHAAESWWAEQREKQK